MTTKNKSVESEGSFHDIPQREDNGTSILFLRDPKEREVVPNVDEKSVMKFVSIDRNNRKFPSLHEHLGSPDYTDTDLLSDEEVALELDRLMNLMVEKHLALRTFTRISERELHRFITKELFPQLTRGSKIVLLGDLIYEEFHPNDHYMIKKVASEFLREFLGQEAWELNWDRQTVLENKKSLMDFVDQYESVYVDELEFDELAIEDGDKASVIFEASLYGHAKDGVFVHHIEGDGQAWLRKINGCWQITCIHFPDRVK